MNAIEQIREEHKNVANRDGLTAVIVKTYYSARKFNMGVQFWNEQMINDGKSVNSDRTTSTFVCVL